MSSDFLETEYGRFSVDFKYSKLSDLCTDKDGVQTGPFGTQLHNEDYVEIGTPIITVEHLGENRILHSDAPLVSDDDKKRLSKYQLIEGDIVFSRVGSVDRRALVRAAENGWLFSGRCLRVRTDKKKIDPTFLSYFFGLDSFKNYVRGIAVGATMPSINTKILSDLPIYFPENLDVQKKIGKILSAFDDKIELNRQTNQTLEQIAQALFKSWFVDFEPTRAKIAAKEAGAAPEEIERAAMCAISGKTPDQLAQLPPETQQNLKITAALFPDALVDSELGEVPEGWEIGCLGDQIDFATGFTFKSEDFTSDGIRLARGDNVKEGAFQWGDKTRYWAEVTPDLEKYLLRSGDILIGMDGSKVGKNWVRVSKSDLPCLLVQRVARLRPNGKIGSSMLEILIGGESFKSYVENVKTGTTIPHISGKQIKDLPIIRPDDEGKLFSEFESVLKNLASKRECHLEESLGLTELRDILLPKLLSGEISLIDVHEEFK